MSDDASIRPLVASLSAAQRPRQRAVAGLVLLAALWLTTTGCTSIYHRTQKVLPPEPGAQLTLRLDEARRAESLTAQAGTRLRDDLARHLPGETIQADLDRLEMAALDLRRRTATARELAAVSQEHSEVAREIERLDLRSLAWLDCVKSAREAEPATRLAQLDSLLSVRKLPGPFGQNSIANGSSAKAGIH
jgi:hypothetical protein